MTIQQRRKYVWENPLKNGVERFYSFGEQDIVGQVE